MTQPSAAQKIRRTVQKVQPLLSVRLLFLLTKWIEIGTME